MRLWPSTLRPQLLLSLLPHPPPRRSLLHLRLLRLPRMLLPHPLVRQLLPRLPLLPLPLPLLLHRRLLHLRLLQPLRRSLRPQHQSLLPLP
jgi:hypothetical protein